MKFFPVRKEREAAGERLLALAAYCKRQLATFTKGKPAPPPAASRTRPAPRAVPPPSKAVALPAPRPKAKIDPTAVYAALNSPQDACGECGNHGERPLHGVRALDIKPAPRARTVAEMVRDTYGFAGGGEGLIGTSSRGGR